MTLDRYSAQVALTQYTGSITAGALLAQALVHQLTLEPGSYFAWPQNTITKETGLGRKSWLSARRVAQEHFLLDYDQDPGHIPAYCVNVELALKIINPPPPAEAAPAEAAPAEVLHDPSTINHQPSTISLPASLPAESDPAPIVVPFAPPAAPIILNMLNMAPVEHKLESVTSAGIEPSAPLMDAPAVEPLPNWRDLPTGGTSQLEGPQAKTDVGIPNPEPLALAGAPNPLPTGGTPVEISTPASGQKIAAPSPLHPLSPRDSIYAKNALNASCNALNANAEEGENAGENNQTPKPGLHPATPIHPTLQTELQRLGLENWQITLALKKHDEIQIRAYISRVKSIAAAGQAKNPAAVLWVLIRDARPIHQTPPEGLSNQTRKQREAEIRAYWATGSTPTSTAAGAMVLTTPAAGSLVHSSGATRFRPHPPRIDESLSDRAAHWGALVEEMSAAAARGENPLWTTG